MQREIITQSKMFNPYGGQPGITFNLPNLKDVPDVAGNGAVAHYIILITGDYPYRR